LARGFTHGLNAKGLIAGAHVFENRLFGARSDDRLRTAIDEHVGAAPWATIVLDRHEAKDRVGAPILSVPERDHATTLDVHSTANASDACEYPRVPRYRFSHPSARARRNSPNT